MTTCPQQITESFEVIGPSSGTLFGGTYGAALSDGGTVCNYINDLPYFDSSGVDSMEYIRAEYPGPTPGTGSLPILSRHELRPGSGGVYTNNITADPDGNIYFWDQSVFPQQIIKQNQDTFEVLRTGPSEALNLDGIKWNPYYSMLYWVSPTAEGYLRRVDPVTGDETPLEAGLDTVADEPSFTPDGAIWLAKVGSFPAGDGFYRYDIDTDTLTSVDVGSVPGIPTGSSVITADNMPGGTPGAIAYRSTDGDGIILAPDFTWTVSSCQPFIGVDSGTARVNNTRVNGRWITPFIWPTTGGFGYALWEQRGVSGSFGPQHIGWPNSTTGTWPR